MSDLHLEVATTWLVVETTVFQKGAAKYLTPRELRAMHREIVDDPLSGRPVEQFPGYFILDWGKQSPLEILYFVVEGQLTVVLVEVQPATQTIEIEKGQEKPLKDVYDVLKRAAGWAAGRWLWSVIKKLLDLE